MMIKGTQTDRISGGYWWETRFRKRQSQSRKDRVFTSPGVLNVACIAGFTGLGTSPTCPLDSGHTPRMKLAALLRSEQVMLDMRSEEHMEAIIELVDHLISVDGLDAGLREEVVESLKAREEKVSTGIGYGVAIPHAFSEKLDHVVAIFGRSDNGIDFEALDNCPVHFVVLFIVPKKDYHMHLQTLAAIAKMFTNCDIRNKLREAEDCEEILNILAGKDSRNVA